MTKTDGEFFEEFKRLEKFCEDIYGCNHAIGSYIEDMRAHEREGRVSVSGWTEDLRALVRCRRLRNVLAHESEEGICTDGDVGWVRSFRGRLLRREDPLALLAAKKRSEEEVKRKNSAALSSDRFDKVSETQTKSQPVPSRRNEKRGEDVRKAERKKLVAVAVCVGALVLLSLLALLLSRQFA